MRTFDGSDGRENATSFLHVRDASRSSAQYRCRRVEGDATFDPSPRCVTDLSTCSHWTNSERVYICATFRMSPPHDLPSFPHIPPSRSQTLHPATVPHIHLFVCKEDARRRPQRPQCIRLERVRVAETQGEEPGGSRGEDPTGHLGGSSSAFVSKKDLLT